MIKELIDEYKRLAFFCNDIHMFRTFLKDCLSEGIVLSRNGKTIIDFKEYENNLLEGYRPIALIVYKQVVDKEQNDQEWFSLFARNESTWNDYDDCNEYHIIDYTKFSRDEKIKNILNID